MERGSQSPWENRFRSRKTIWQPHNPEESRRNSHYCPKTQFNWKRIVNGYHSRSRNHQRRISQVALACRRVASAEILLIVEKEQFTHIGLRFETGNACGRPDFHPGLSFFKGFETSGVQIPSPSVAILSILPAGGIVPNPRDCGCVSLRARQILYLRSSLIV